MADATLNLAIEEVIIGDRRPVNDDAVKRLSNSIRQIGLQHPITVRSVRGEWILVAGRHRLEACKRLGHVSIMAGIAKMDEIDAEMWEISENLHRAELTKLERDEQISRWVELIELKRVSAQVDQKPQGGRPEGGIAAASRELGIERKDAARAVQVAALSDEAKEAAREHGLDDNRSALLEAAAKPSVAEQVAAIHARATAQPVRLAPDPLNDFEAKEKQVEILMNAWNKAGPEAREEFLGRIDQPLMDRRYGA